MNTRPELNKLVFGILQTKSVPVTALQIYQEVREMNHGIIRREKVTTFKSFTVILNSWKDIERSDEHRGRYKVVILK